VDRFPFSFPNGWFQAMYSDDLAVGEVKSVRYHARDLVLFRDEAGQPALLDAHCPHLGAHLGVGGRVVGEALRCPFHGWEWAGDGRCVGIPYAKRIPANARVGSYPTVEKNGVIYFWYHAEGEAPSFEIPALPEVADPDFTSPWSRTEWTIRTHPQEILENGVDFQHLTPVHELDPPEGFRFESDGPISTWTVGSSKSAEPLDGATDTIDIRTDNYGLGVVVSRYVGFFSTLLHLAYTPIDEESCRVVVGSIGKCTDRSGDQAESLLEAYMADVAGQIDRDKPIWENKRYRSAPLLCEEDGPIPEYRRWASQFYSAEASPASA
jgi:3-ketosteroid 9alpha-monooxygenase subunit A